MAETKTKKPAAKAPAKKASGSKKPVAKKTTSSSKKPSAKAPSKKVVSSKAKTTSSKSKTKKINNSITIDVSKMPKRIKIEGYTCIWRMYLLVDKKTKEQHKKRFWIVIGDGHKWYRKFETQAEAINYFRRLKKYAKMRVQTIKTSRKFIKTVYTFYEMIYRGIDINELKKLESQSIEWNENEDYVDSFDAFDKFENSPVQEEEEDETIFSEEEINKIIAENEKDAVIVEDEPEEEEEPNFVTEVIKVEEEQEPVEEPQKVFTITQEQVIEKQEEQPQEEVDPYALTKEIEFVDNNEDIIDNDNNNTNDSSLYDLSYENQAQSTEPEVDDFEITQHQTTLVMPDEDLSQGDNDMGLRKYYWLTLILLCLVLAFIVVVSILTATDIIK